MTLTLLTQQEIDQIPHLIYKKILIEYNNVIDINTELNHINIQKQAEINNLNIEIKKMASSNRNLNLSRHFLEIENEFYKMRVESLNKVLDLLDIDYVNKDKKSNKKRISASNSSTTNPSVISKLIKKIKSLTKKYKLEKRKFKKIFSEFTEVLRARDQIYESFSRNQIDIRKLEECKEIFNKGDIIEKEYFNMLEKCNRMEYEYNRLSFENRDLRYKYDRYILSNREDIIPVIGRELDNIKDKIFDFTTKIDYLDVKYIFREYWKYIEILKSQVMYYKNLDRHKEPIKDEINIIRNILSDVNKEIDDTSEIYKKLVKEIYIINEIIQDLYKERIGKEILTDSNYLLLEIHSYRKKIKNLEMLIEKQNCDKQNSNKQVEIQNEKDQIINEKDQIINEKDEIINEKDEIINEKDEIINEKDQIINEKDNLIKEKDNLIKEKDEIIKKLSILLTKLRKIKEEYIALKKSAQPE